MALTIVTTPSTLSDVIYRSRSPQTAWARHLDRVRREREWSATRMFEEAREALGLGPKSRSAFLPLLVDKEPDLEQARALASLFGEPTDEPLPAPAPDLAAALLALATSQADLARELAALREERTALVRRVEDLAATVELLAAQRLEGNGGHATPGAPLRSAE